MHGLIKREKMVFTAVDTADTVAAVAEAPEPAAAVEPAGRAADADTVAVEEPVDRAVSEDTAASVPL